MSRTWVYDQMMGHTAMNVIVGQRIYSTTSLQKAPSQKPFIMYRQLSNRPDMRGDDGSLVKDENWLIFVHDIPGDYLQIDQLLRYLRELFEDTYDQGNGIIRSMWLEDSEDFRDDDMGTILKYARISVKYRV